MFQQFLVLDLGYMYLAFIRKKSETIYHPVGVYIIDGVMTVVDSEKSKRYKKP